MSRKFVFFQWEAWSHHWLFPLTQVSEICPVCWQLSTMSSPVFWQEGLTEVSDAWALPFSVVCSRSASGIHAILTQAWLNVNYASEARNVSTEGQSALDNSKQSFMVGEPVNCMLQLQEHVFFIKGDINTFCSIKFCPFNQRDLLTGALLISSWLHNLHCYEAKLYTSRDKTPQKHNHTFYSIPGCKSKILNRIKLIQYAQLYTSET